MSSIAPAVHPRLGEIRSQNGRAFGLLVPGESDPYTDGIAVGRSTAESLRTLELLVTPDDVVLDLGANVGEYTLVLASLASRVTAVEASADIANLLRANIAMNAIDNCDVVVAAAGATNGPDHLTLSGTSAYGTALDIANPRTQRVTTVAASSLISTVRPTVMKVDIEGYEQHVRYVLCDFVTSGPNNVLVVEVNLGAHFGGSAVAVLEVLRTTGLPMWCLYPELPGSRCVPLETDFPLRTVSDLLVTGRPLPAEFDTAPITADEQAALYAEP